MIFVDNLGHLVSNQDDEELHEFARKLKLKRSWFQAPPKVKYPHYDLTTKRKIGQAILQGASFVRPREIVRILKERQAGS